MKRNLKQRTAGSLKWNLVDRLSTQVLYAITGIVLARLLSEEDYGLVGAVLVFQAFAALIVDSGFSFALLQKQCPSRLDYSSVLWFNLGVALILYAALFIGAPLVAASFGGDARLIPLS
ncbi:MAG: oligosaccharide flippase family protein, partial [Muribaculaceae bacterium]|nr:oligosaccharide flippase family protein [Muribaculaceae bacterium]